MTPEYHDPILKGKKTNKKQIDSACQLGLNLRNLTLTVIVTLTIIVTLAVIGNINNIDIDKYY